MSGVVTVQAAATAATAATARYMQAMEITDTSSGLEPTWTALSGLVSRVQMAARRKREHTRERRAHHRHEQKRARVEQVLGDLPQVSESELTGASLGPGLVRAALHLGDAHLLQEWPQAKEWTAPVAPPASSAAATDEPPPPPPTVFGDAASGGCLSWPQEPLRVASVMQAAACPPGGFFETLRLRASVAPAEGGFRRMLTFTLPPTVRTLSALRLAAAEIMRVDPDTIEGILKLPDTLVAEDEVMDLGWAFGMHARTVLGSRVCNRGAGSGERGAEGVRKSGERGAGSGER